MNRRWINLVWGVVLIVVGLLFMVQTLDLIPELPAWLWVGVFAVASALFFVSYVASGLDQWGWLFPALISAALALTTAMAELGVESSLVGAPVLIAVGAPFVAAYLLDRSRNGWALIPAWVMLVVAAVTAVADRLSGTLIGSVVLLSIALPFWVAYLRNRANWWPLIPAWALSVVAAIVAVSEIVPGQLIGTMVMYGMAAPFLAVYARSRANWWALIPAGVFAVVGTIVLLSMQASGELMGALVLFLFAVPFAVAYLWSVENWWALIPAGIFCGVGLAILLTGGEMTGERRSASMTGIMFLTWAAAFGLLWLRRGQQPTAWGIYPAVVLGIGGLVALVFGVDVSRFWPLIPIVVGVSLLASSLRSGRQGPAVVKVGGAPVDAPSAETAPEGSAGASVAGDSGVQKPK